MNNKKENLFGKNLTFCENPWTTLFIDGNGVIRVCACCDNLSDSYEYDIVDIWNNEKIRSMRKALSQGEFSQHCKDYCPYKLNTMQERIVMNKTLIENAKKNPKGTAEKFLKNMKLNNSEFLNGLEELSSYPTFISMCFSMQCNLRCIFCYNKGNYDKKVSDKTKNSIEKLYPYIDTFNFSGGEPTIEKEFWDICTEANFLTYPDWMIGVGTNGFFQEEKIPLMAKYFDRVTISLRAGSKETYEKLHIGGKWDCIIANMDKLKEEIDLCNNKYAKAAKIVLLYVIMRQNYRELPDFFEITRKYNSSVYFIPISKTSHIGEETAMFDYLKKEDIYELDRIWKFCRQKYPQIIVNEDNLKRNWIDNLIESKKKELKFYRTKALLNNCKRLLSRTTKLLSR